MPSAEKLTSAATAVESAPLIEPKIENAPNESDEKSVQAQNSIQQALSIVSNKVRNLEKRKNKLDNYIKEEESGKELSSEQQKAISKYEEVVQQLSLSKEFCKQFQKIANDASKEAKRESRKMLFARQHQEMAKVREVLMIQDLLQRLKVDTVRSDFLNQRNGACPINKAEMDFIEKFAQQAVPVRPNFSNEPSFASAAKASAEVFSFLIDERNREFQDTGYTFEKGKELFNRIQSCGYWEQDVKFVAEEIRAVNDSPQTDDLESKEEYSENMGGKTLAAPAPTQVPTPTFNGNVNNLMSVQQQMQHMHLQKTRNPQQQVAPLSTIPSNAPNMKTTVTAVENAYFNQIKYSHSQQSGGQVMNNNNNNNNTMPISAPNQNDFGTNFSFLQDSELDSPAGSQQQQKMPVKVIQPKHQQVPQQFKNANFHPQSPIGAAAAAAGQIYPPGLKVQQLQNTHIPVNYQASPQQLNQQSAVSTTQVPHMIPKQKQQQPPINGNQNPGYGTQTPPITQRPAASAAYPTMVSSVQYQAQQPVDPKNDAEGEKEKQREEYQEQPQIDTWTNETAAQTGGTYSARSSAGGYNRNSNRSSTTGGGGAKYNNYRNPQQSRNSYNENGSGDSQRENSTASNAPGTFFRNNERYNGSSTSGARFENRGGAGGNYKPRDANYRAGSGRFAGSASAASSQGSSNPAQRK